MDSVTAPLFAVTLTLSSHEPFTVPGPVSVPGSTSGARFLNAQSYTDRAVSTFVERTKKAPWWDSTLVIVIADHGSPYPALGSPLASASGQYRIPMLWLGGALAVRDTVIHRIGSQSDIPNTLLAQLGIVHSQYRWSKDWSCSGSQTVCLLRFQQWVRFRGQQRRLRLRQCGEDCDSAMGDAIRRCDKSGPRVSTGSNAVVRRPLRTPDGIARKALRQQRDYRENP